jgi:hypothetical protein
VAAIIAGESSNQRSLMIGGRVSRKASSTEHRALALIVTRQPSPTDQMVFLNPRIQISGVNI